MKIIKTKNYAELSEKAFQIVCDKILKKPNSVIGFATGASPLGLYKKLVGAYKRKKIDFSKIKSFNLDEYYPIKKNNKKGYYYYMFHNFFNKINIKKENINLLNGEARNFKKECENYENKIRKNPIDIQILGIGINGHVGFNEPGSDFNSKARLVDLASETIEGKRVPKKALTIGISTIMKSKKIILLAYGKKKAKAVRNLVKGKINKNCPASFLRKHKNLFVIIDGKAGSLL